MAGQHEPWAIRVAGDEATRKPGENLKQWAGDERSRTRRFVDRLLERDDKDPRLSGLLGEEAVGRELTKLGDEWTVLHGIRVGARADVDHLVIGPAGVFSLNTKRLAHDSDVVVTPRQFRVNGYSRDYYPKATKEASRVEVPLQAATGVPVVVRPLIVVTGVHRKRVIVREQPTDVTVVLRRNLLGWLLGQPAVLAPDAVSLLARKARRPGTWDESKRDVVLDRMPPSSPPVEQEVEPRDADAVTPLEPTAAVRVDRWKRYGYERLYVNEAATGRRLGWRDEKTGEVHVEEGADGEVVRAALAQEDRRGTSS